LDTISPSFLSVISHNPNILELHREIKKVCESKLREKENNFSDEIMSSNEVEKSVDTKFDRIEDSLKRVVFITEPNIENEWERSKNNKGDKISMLRKKLIDTYDEKHYFDYNVEEELNLGFIFFLE
jgi:hypothetical protein